MGIFCLKLIRVLSPLPLNTWHTRVVGSQHLFNPLHLSTGRVTHSSLPLTSNRASYLRQGPPTPKTAPHKTWKGLVCQPLIFFQQYPFKSSRKKLSYRLYKLTPTDIFSTGRHSELLHYFSPFEHCSYIYRGPVRADFNDKNK